MGWTDIKASWPDGWQDFASDASRMWATRVTADPERFSGPVTATLNELTLTGRYLVYLGSLVTLPLATLTDRDNYARLRARYNVLAAGVYAEAQPAPAPGFGVAPAVVGGLVVMGLLISVAGVAFAIAAYEYCVNLREQTALADRELTERVRASEQGRALQPSTLPVPPPDGPIGEGNSFAAGAVLVLVSAGAIAWLARRT